MFFLNIFILLLVIVYVVQAQNPQLKDVKRRAKRSSSVGEFPWVGRKSARTSKGFADNNLLWRHIPNDCGKTRFDSLRVRIIGGDRADLGQFPWMVRIGTMFPENKTISFFCAGTIINRYYVISAAHCEAEANIVRVGENYVNTDIDCDRLGVCAPRHQDIEIKRHLTSNFRKETLDNDLSLIELKKPIVFNDFVQPICLLRIPSYPNSLLYKSLTVPGWGAIETINYKNSEYLTYINPPVLQPAYCNMIYDLSLKSNQLCVGYLNEGKDSCLGDSGGPASKSMLINGKRRTYLIGVVSFGLTICGTAPAVYTNVSYHMDWVLSKIDKS